MLKEFKAFIMRGNVIDLAIGVIIGAAFGKIISSLVEDIITPLLLQPALKAAGAENIQTWAPGGVFIGKFISAALAFIIIAFVLFLIIKGVNAASKKRQEEAGPPPSPSNEEKLLIEIRDALRK
ncbi:MAG: large conductance mechanosensitive channel protein MscL [Flavobacteriales bacterium]|nr:large conductance mechanosensitive channel protein MscL [Flavobacteriales bacterium]